MFPNLHFHTLIFYIPNGKNLLVISGSIAISLYLCDNSTVICGEREF
nr:MAG TPA: hypothetical protein [Caudoviricetes sp.]DAN06758.1 MAG TPA: hypothetical protein [Caudoviricetes sp.]DAR47861.1 MAG TPA: hypothetical protein [Bacteriophage sp.]